LWAFDMTMVTVAFGLAYLARFRFGAGDPAPAGETYLLLATALVICTAVFRMSGLYESHRFTTRGHEIYRIFQGTALSKLPLAATAAFARLLEQRQVDQVYIALPLGQHRLIREVLATLATSHADVKVVPDLHQFMTLHGGVEDVDGMPVVALRHGPVHGWDAV